MLQQAHSMFLGFNGFGLQVLENIVFSMWVLIKSEEDKWATRNVIKNLNFRAQLISWSYQCGFGLSLFLLSQGSKISWSPCPRHIPYAACLPPPSLLSFLTYSRNPEIIQLLQHYHSIFSDL